MKIDTVDKDFVIRFSIESFDQKGHSKFLIQRLWVNDLDSLLNLLENDDFIDFLEQKGLIIKDE